MSSEDHHATLKERAVEELKEFAVLFAYLFGILLTFRVYTELILMSRGSGLTHFGWALITALIGAKVILLTQNLEVTRSFEHKDAHLWSAVFKTWIFYLFMVAFTVVEKGVEGMLHHHGFVGGITEAIEGAGIWQIVASNLVVIAALFPLFLFKEIDRVLGYGTLRKVLLGEKLDKPRELD